ncbi:MBL fold metallo-hydrolase [Geobacter sulfurreducens]|uniref:Metal-dependent hydrolase, beta-lactamase superfamily n=1 Tax=Geobacter sulfurreducens (strain ATCC 51573 / DSM 12127 / PCA) TaxID=243231 RepID=Q74DV5_GEOSL|nr:MBL fold metallo-hydrolase [Geobacter sulfurreducens]AAR34586.2 metal-dependent hydrolase, beta-lactamase superfamily [Geobacter sulfurreducens PCA]ADI84045.1 metal-dependent hydrolase, beta-lactamase superfamily [Geobacter sulfurreducens KN400]UAC05241.1 MBL fold metallo-hydrolase [Geobacter sulfurreducens]HBB69260.1 MBL fold metallo-hydrolase [Geobacter sulfurreducens]HCD97288.1 MBL fold metallo-hydrolase [Geobacter sulfurreducens]
MASLTLRHLAGNTWLIPAPAAIGVYVRNGRAVLIDSGNDEEAGRQILKLLNGQGWTLDLIVNTHSNADHIGGNAFLQKKTGCRVAATVPEAAFIANPILEPSFLYGGYPVKALRNKFLMAKPSTVTDIIEAIGPILDTGLEAVPLAGHFFGMIGIRTPDGVLFAADSLFPETILAKYPIFYLYDIREHLASLQRLRELEAAIYVPSHGAPSPEILPLIEANEQRVRQTVSFVESCCTDAPASFETVLERVCGEYGIVLDPNQYVLVGNTIRSILAFLSEEGRLAMIFDGGRLLWGTAADQREA